MRRTLLRAPAFARDLRNWLKSRPGAAVSIETSIQNCASRSFRALSAASNRSYGKPNDESREEN